MSDARVAVVGGGVVGLACAWELRRRGAERRRARARRRSAGACRAATPAGSRRASPIRCRRPGMVREGLRQLVTGGEAFVLRPSLDPAFVRWLWSFRRSCSSARFDAGVRALLALNRRTLELFDAYRDAGVAFEMHTAGLVVAARTPGGLDLYRRIFRRLRELGYEGGAIDELDGRGGRRARARARPRRGRRGPARAGRPVRPPRGADGRPRASICAPTGSRSARAAELRALAAGATAAGRSRPAPAVRCRRERVVVAAGLATAPLLRRLGVRVAADGRARLQRHGRRPRHAAAPRALPGRGQARPEPVRRRRAHRRRVRAGRARRGRRAGRRRAAARRGASVPRRAGSPTPTVPSRPGPACGRRRRTGCR